MILIIKCFNLDANLYNNLELRAYDVNSIENYLKIFIETVGLDSSIEFLNQYNPNLEASIRDLLMMKKLDIMFQIFEEALSS